MPRLHIVPCVIAASFLASCSGNGATTPSTGQMPLRSFASKRLSAHITPLPPKHRRPITAAMRAEAKKGGWTELSASSPFANGADSEILMTDGTVLVRDYCTANWFRLSPDSTGNYLNGTWSSIAALPSGYAPLYFGSAVLPDGKLIMNGGEYNDCGRPVETNLGAIYDPVANTWTAVNAPSGWGSIGDGQSAVLDNGTYMLGNCCSNQQALYNESTSTWTVVGNGKNDDNSEEGWTLLRSGNLIDADVIAAPASEEYNAKSQSWKSAGDLLQNLTQAVEIGPQIMMPDGNVFVIGANGDTALFKPSTGKWSEGPEMPNNTSGQLLDIADGPATVLTDGTVLAAASPGVYKAPTTFVLYSGGKKIALFPTPASAVNDPSYGIRLLMLPNGQVLETDDSSDVEVYTGKESVYPGIAPKVTSVSHALTAGGTFKISGKNFNGFTQENFYGDDDQQAENYPLVRITNNSSGTVTFAKTFGFSTMAIGSKKTISASFQLPAGIPTGASKLEVVTNGISSAPVSVTIASST